MDSILMQNPRAVDDELLGKLKTKKYTSGRDVMLGDRIYYGLILNEKSATDIDLELISFNLDEIDSIYRVGEYDTTVGNVGTKLPILIKIGNVQ